MTGQAPSARRLAIEALVRIDEDGAYANLVLPKMLGTSSLSERDRGFVTELVYGTTRMRRACDHLIEPYLLSDVDSEVRAALRIGAYQLLVLETPRHAAVGETVGAVKRKARGLVNAVLRRVADALDGGPVRWPDDATRLSYPDWIVNQVVADLGDEGLAALAVMNQPAKVHERDDGYVQDRASQAVVDAVGAAPGERILDLCAAPGGKATGMAGAGAIVVAADLRPHRVNLIVQNAVRTGVDLAPVVADGTQPPFRSQSFDRVLIDAPCSGLGSLRRRADARWRIDADAPERLADLQIALVRAGFDLLRVGGTLVYSVCTLTEAEGAGVRRAVEVEFGTGADVGPLTTMVPTEDSDGMLWFSLTRRGDAQPLADR